MKKLAKKEKPTILIKVTAVSYPILEINFEIKKEVKTIKEFKDWFLKNYFMCKILKAIRIFPNMYETELIELIEFKTSKYI